MLKISLRSFKIEIYLFVIQFLLIGNMMIHQLLSVKKLFDFLAMICNKKSTTLNDIFSENTEKMNDEPTNLTKPFQFDDSELLDLTLSPKPESYINQLKLHHRLKKMQHETIGGTTKYLSCAATVQQKICFLPMKMVSPAGIAARNA